MILLPKNIQRNKMAQKTNQYLLFCYFFFFIILVSMRFARSTHLYPKKSSKTHTKNNTFAHCYTHPMYPLNTNTQTPPTHTPPNTLQMIGNSINHSSDNSLEHELNDRGMSLQDDETASMKSYGSHKNRMFKDESHKGSAETLDGGEKHHHHLSHEDRLDLDGGRWHILTHTN